MPAKTLVEPSGHESEAEYSALACEALRRSPSCTVSTPDEEATELEVFSCEITMAGRSSLNLISSFEKTKVAEREVGGEARTSWKGTEWSMSPEGFQNAMWQLTVRGSGQQ